MRIERLDLVKFGPFTDVRLALPEDGPVLHVIRGRNEAGKSTALRALIGLLFGIPERTGDAHVHAKKDLRVGAVLRSATGRYLEVVRRKGRKNTLLDPREQPLDDAVLQGWLGGVGQERFTAMFGLDHETLRQGAEALLAGQGDVGESLFDAGTGGRGVHAVLAELEREAEAIYTDKSKTRTLNLAMREFREAKRRVADAGVTARAWQEQKEGIARAEAELASLQRRQRAVRADKLRLQRDGRVLPLLGERKTLRAERAALGEPPRLAADARERRLAAQQEGRDAAAERARLQREIEDLDRQRRGLDVPEALLLLSDERVQELSERLVQYRATMAALPERRAALARSGRARREVMRQLGRTDGDVEGMAQRVDAGTRARVRALVGEHPKLDTRLENARKAVADHAMERARCEQRLQRIPAPRDVSALEAALAAAVRLGDVAQQLAEGEAALARLRADADMELQALGRWQGPLEAAVALPVPPRETVERFATRAAELTAERRALERRAEEAVRRGRELACALEAEERAGAVPTEAQLAEARRERDVLWRAARAAPDDDPAAAAFERALRRADDLADRLRHEAERVARYGELLAQRRACEAEEREGAAALDDVRARVARHEEQWHALWEPAGVAALPPAEMRAWLGRLVEVRARAARLADRREEQAALRARRDGCRSTLGRALRELGEPDEGDLDVAITRARAVLDRAGQDAQARRTLTAEIEGIEARQSAARAQLEEQQRVMARWREGFGDVVARLGLGPDAQPDEAAAILEQLVVLGRELETASELRREIEDADAEAAGFAAEVEALVAAHLPEVAPLALEEQADQLVRRHRQARKVQVKRDALDEQLQRRRQELAAVEAKHAGAHAALAALVEAAGAEDVVELEVIEQRAARLAELDRRLGDLERSIQQEGAGATLEELEAATAGASPQEIAVRLQEVEDELERLDEDIGGAREDLGSLRGGERELARCSAEEAAAEAESHLSRLRDHARRYLRLRAAATLLQREIDRYREDNQAPILRRADELFARLTLQHYAGLKVAIGGSDEPVLRCVRADRTEVDVDGLSDGTRDQLYLALRVASLERHAAHDEPMPFVVDDVLIHFDDDRARAALEVLGDLARTTQVLFFTHHEHLCALAREAVPDLLVEHDLDALRAASAPAAS